MPSWSYFQFRIWLYQLAGMAVPEKTPSVCPQATWAWTYHFQHKQNKQTTRINTIKIKQARQHHFWSSHSPINHYWQKSICKKILYVLSFFCSGFMCWTKQVIMGRLLKRKPGCKKETFVGPGQSNFSFYLSFQPGAVSVEKQNKTKNREKYKEVTGYPLCHSLFQKTNKQTKRGGGGKTQKFIWLAFDLHKG